MDALHQRTRHLGIDAGFEQHDSLYLDGTVLCPRDLAREAEARRGAGFEVTLLEPPDVERRVGIRGRTAILSYDQLAADPRRLATDFLRAAVSRGTRLVSPADITTVAPSSDEVIAGTSAGPAIRARHLVFATGYEVPVGRAARRPRDGLHVGDRHQAPAAELVARPLHDLGSVRSRICTSARHWAGASSAAARTRPSPIPPRETRCCRRRRGSSKRGWRRCFRAWTRAPATRGAAHSGCRKRECHPSAPCPACPTASPCWAMAATASRSRPWRPSCCAIRSPAAAIPTRDLFAFR